MVLGQRAYILLWSGNREAEGRLFRPYPENCIRAEHFGLSSKEEIPKGIDHYTMQGKQGNGIYNRVRANESMMAVPYCSSKVT